MLVCFGFSWPFAIAKTIRVKDPSGKSFAFMALVAVGYLAGCLHKIYHHFDGVFWLYVLNGVLVITDMALTCYYLRRNRRHQLSIARK